MISKTSLIIQIIVMSFFLSVASAFLSVASAMTPSPIDFRRADDSEIRLIQQITNKNGVRNVSNRIYIVKFEIDKSFNVLFARSIDDCVEEWCPTAVITQDRNDYKLISVGFFPSKVSRYDNIGRLCDKCDYYYTFIFFDNKMSQFDISVTPNYVVTNLKGKN